MYPIRQEHESFVERPVVVEKLMAEQLTWQDTLVGFHSKGRLQTHEPLEESEAIGSVLLAAEQLS